jgi:Protein kinase domain
MTMNDEVTLRPSPDETPTLHVAAAGAPPRGNRFTPGTLLLGRYRIVNLVGRGGMGEVYRADDVKLGQQVALKFIPRELVADPSMLRMLLAEVRIGREVSHPNVCRLYDVVELDGDHFISMQFVDGEDLASLLRRIGRLPVEKAIDVARDIAAGLAAAHDRGVIHRDLKPANVMIDGKGRAHISDFGLAILGDDPQRRMLAGTPVYMAPEQLSGEPVTTASDVYALGLIVWEMLTGRRLFDGGSLPQIAEAHLSPKPRVSSSVHDAPAELERLLAHCLEEEPERRPQSAREVLAMLPGGDPLAAAVAAGETPAPELVAAAAKTGVVAPALAYGGLALFVALLAGVALLTPRTTLFSPQWLRKPPDVLADRAEELVHACGIAGDPADHTATFMDRGHHGDPMPDRDRAALIYRRAPVALKPEGRLMRVTQDDPPLTTPGMATVVMTAGGRLLSFTAVPRADAAPAPGALDALFHAAGYERAQLTPAAPRFAPPVGSDARMAFDGAAHIEAATFHGAPVWFAIDPAPPARERVQLAGWGGVAWNAVFTLILVAASLMAWRNLRLGRIDRRGATRAALAAAVVSTMATAATGHLRGSSISEILQLVLGNALFDAAYLWVCYVAIEPYARRNWPTLLISWQRLVALRWRDPLVARDAGIGLLCGMSSAAVLRAIVAATAPRVPPMSTALVAPFSSLGGMTGWLLHVVPEGMLNGLAALVLLVVGRVLIRRAAVYVPLFVLAVAMAIAPDAGSTIGDAVYGVFAALLLLVALRAGGLLAAVTSWMAYHVVAAIPLTLDANAWFAPRALGATLPLLAAAAYAAVTMTGGRRFAMMPRA